MKKIVVFAFIGLFALSGCEKFLEEDNKGGTNNDEFYRTPAGYQTLVVAAYNTLRTVFGGIPWLQIAGTDMYNMARGFAERPLMQYEQLFPDNGTVLTFYRNCYNAIQVTNVGLYYNDVAEVDDQTRARLRAEFAFLRAFYHFLLIEQFGGIVINNEPTLAARMDLPRASLETSYDFVITEMEAALPDLGNDRARVNKTAANHYLAKVYLTRAWDLGNEEDFQRAKQYAADAIGGRAISIPFETLWHPDNDNNEEVIFAVQYSIGSIATEQDGNAQQGIFGPYLGGAELNHKYMSASLFPSWNLHNFFQENDARYEATFMLTIYDQYFDYYDQGKDKTQIPIRAYYPRVWGREFTRADSLAWVEGKEHQIASNFRYFPFKYDEEAYRAAFEMDFHMPVVRKFDSPVTRHVFSQTASVRDVVLARLAETYFLYAEACIGLNDFGTAAQYVQQVLDRPGNAKDGGRLRPNLDIAGAASQSEALDAYLIESAKEFVGEYLRWPELRRTKKLKEFVGHYNYDVRQIGLEQAFRGLDGQDKLYRPIPIDAITLNEAQIEQNPGYPR
ncbi:Starch-binding associating with outer membrane [Parapedobacter composti]|uniref:Starch-binding associating with outer membrane n=1 Tax=Parapedobacter composti TaxID=623281 RepID=A0A1I1HW24_9SPHI|nr:RagB/SusD family nutrient uptake outer membrane protein [Parapedobacter composti]SFC27975.1 Starch-binding associating with outer membrane [Parapedobacter composti]